MAEKGLKMESSMPLYAQLMERIRVDILAGVYPVGERIPPEHEIEMRYGVSRVTVRRAIQELTGAGLLERKQGKGTFVSHPKTVSRLREIQGFHDACREMGLRPSVGKISVREISADAADADKLGLPAESALIEIRRVLLADGIPVILEKNHFSTAYAWLENAGLQGSLYRLLQEYGIRAEKSIYDFSMRKVDPDEAGLLQIEPEQIVMSVTQVVYDQRGRPLHTSDQLIRGELYTLKI